MIEPKIKSLEAIPKKIITALEYWLEEKITIKCPFSGIASCQDSCGKLFSNLGNIECPCYQYGEKESILAAEIICDTWKAYCK